MEHVLIRKLEHLTGAPAAPRLAFAVETRDRPGPVYKHGAFEGDQVWVQLHGGLFVAKATVHICWVGEYSSVQEVRARTRGSSLHDLDGFWAARPRYGFAAVATLRNDSWIEPYWGGPRTYTYEWVALEDQKKRSSWLERRDPPRTGDGLRRRFSSWMKTR
ncbi:MAG: hypothetical protein ACREJP_06320 [Candidatus Methylomirabilales bacterium]